MLTKRIIPCLDIKDGRTVKGVNFVNLIDSGDPVELAQKYSNEGADELVFLDITATENKRKTLIPLVEAVARQVAIPFTVGGGVSSAEDVSVLLQSGADKVAVNSAAFKRPKLISEIAGRYGNQCLVLAIDAKMINGSWKVHLVGGKQATDKDLFEWAREGADNGAGEILFTSMNNDGTKDGFALEALQRMTEELDIPVIASGGAGTKEHFRDVFLGARVDAALAASVFHFNEISIPELKDYLRTFSIPLR
jgi:imidazole glycerol-phosphate synthase subunit HisF